MKQAMRLRSDVIGLSVLLCLGGLETHALCAEVQGRSPRFLAHLLDYLAKDYGRAVEHGKVVSASEYREQVEFADSALETSSQVSETQGVPEIQKKLKKLNHLIHSKAEATQVSHLAREIQAQVIQVAKIEMAPTRWPNLARGKELYRQSCVACHGAKGAGNGTGGLGLNPKPANFLDGNAMKGLSPFQAFNTIRLGVPGTGMAAYHGLPDQEVWDLSFYVVSLRYDEKKEKLLAKATSSEIRFDQEILKKVATHSDEKLATLYPKEKENEVLVALRTHSGNDDSGGSLSVAQTHLDQALKEYESGNKDTAKTLALRAYLEGIEPIEPRLKASDPGAVIKIESRMATVRSAIEHRKSLEEVKQAISYAQVQIEVVNQMIQDQTMSPGLTFMAAFAILLREGFEAVLIILALLGVIRAAGTKQAALWVHGGWITALGLGGVAWIFSGWLMALSGASREMMEAATSLFAVVVLLLVGFWLHNQTELSRWRGFIEGKVKRALEGKHLLGLAMISFVAVFREAFETVLFLRAIWLEGASASRLALGLGVLSALLLIFALAYAILKYSARVPIRKLFTISSALMAILALVLTGKGLHSLQETGMLPITASPWNVRWDLFGFYPTFETLTSQVIILALVIALWIYGRKPTHPAVKEV